MLSFIGNNPAVVRLGFPGAHPSEMKGVDPFPGQIHYVMGRDPVKRPDRVETFHGILYRNLFPGVDLIFHQGESSLEYDFHVAPYADAGAIRIRVKGARRIVTQASGDLLISLSHGQIRMRRPEVFQSQDLESGQKTLVSSRYQVDGDSQVTFQLGAYDRSRPLVIDPVLSYSTYLGGSGNDNAAAVALDAAGSAYITGQTISADFPLSAPEQSQNSGQTDVFVTKVNAAGTAWIYSTYLGGSGNDAASGIAVDSSGNAYVTGLTRSYDFPLAAPYQAGLSGGQDAFVTKLNAGGSTLIYSTYLGGSGSDLANSVAVDRTGSAVVAGSTASSDFPLRRPLQPVFGGAHDGFVTKIAPDGASLIYSTYLGGAGGDSVASLALDPAGNAYAAGQTASSNFPVVNALLPSLQGTSDAFVTKINTDGSAFGYSTFLGGTGGEAAGGIAVDAAGNAVIVGVTTSINFPVKNALRATPIGNGDAFVSKLNQSGAALIYSTYLGGTGSDNARAVTLDSNANAYVAGSTTSLDFPVLAAVQSSPGAGGDAFVTAITAAGSGLFYSTLLGGTGSDSAQGIAADTQGNVVVAGITTSAGLATSLQPYLAGGQDAFASRIFQNGPVLSLSPGTLAFPGSGLGISSAALPVTITNVGNQPATLSAIFASSDFSQANTCGSILAASFSCTIQVTFNPTVAGLRRGAISVTANTATGFYVIPLSGSGVTPVPFAAASLSPPSAAPGGSAFIIRVQGSGFQPGAVVNWNASPRPTTFISSTQLSAQIQAADIATAGTAVITVTNPVQFGPTLSNTQVFLTGTGRGVTVSDWSQPSVILYNREEANKCVQVHSIQPSAAGDICLTCGSTGFGGGIAFHNGKLSPDGHWIAMQVTVAGSSGCASVDGGPGSGNNQEIWVASYPNLAQSQLRVSPACIPGQCENLVPVWNPQGTSIAFGSRQAFCTNPGPPDCAMKMAIANISFPGGVPVLGATTFIDVNASNPGTVEPWSWKADGSILYYSGHDTTNPYPSLTVNSLTGNSPAVLTPFTGSDAWNEFPTWARNGAGIFFSSSRSSPQECSQTGCPAPLFPLNEINFMSPDGSRVVTLSGLNTPGSPDYRGGNPAAANGVALNPSGNLGLIDEETPGTAKWISMANIVWPPSVTSNPVPFSVQVPAPVSFRRLDLAVNNLPAAVAAADLNGDRNPDLAVASTVSGMVSVLTGRGDGTFGTGMSLPTAPNPIAIALGDFNGDGIPDIATANNGSWGVSILLSGQNGSYLAHADYPAGLNPVSIATGDVNLDGKLDLITANLGDGTISVLLGNGDGTFQRAVSYAAGKNPASVILADFNGDSRLDVAVVNFTVLGNSSVSVMLGAGDGSFPRRVQYATGMNSWSEAATDLNGDGKVDLVVVNANAIGSANGDNVSVLLGNGDGTFRSSVNYATGKNAYSVAVADFDRDGKLDLAIANRGSSTVSLLAGNGDGTFQRKTDYPVAQTPASLAAQDFDGDGRADLAIASGTSSAVTLLFQNH